MSTLSRLAGALGIAPADSSADRLTALADRIAPKALHPAGGSYEAAAARDSILQAEEDSQAVAVALDQRSAMRAKRAVLAQVMRRYKLAARLRTCAARLGEDRAAAARDVEAAAAEVAGRERTAAAAADRASRAAAQAATRQAELDAHSAAAAASRTAAEDRVRAAIREGDEAAEAEAARALDAIGAHAPDAGLVLRASETKRLAEELGTAAAARQAEHAQALQALRQAEAEVVAVASDTALVEWSLVLVDLALARNAARAAGVAKPEVRYSPSGMVRVARGGRCWFAEGASADDPADVHVAPAVENVVALLAAALPDVALLSRPLPELRSAALAESAEG